MRVLIVEDEPDLLSGLARALRDEGYAVDTATNGEEGLYSAESNEYDAVVLDVMMPKLDGWEVLARLRKQKKTAVLMLTAKDQSRDRVRGLDTGADDYVVKPFDLDELLARLRALIRRTSGTVSSRIEFADLVIDTAARTVHQRGQPVILTAREYALWNISFCIEAKSSRARLCTSICSTRMIPRSRICWTSTSRISAENSGTI